MRRHLLHALQRKQSRDGSRRRLRQVRHPPPAAAAGAALLWAQGLAPGRPEDLSGSEEVEPGCPYPPSAQVAPFPHRRPACPRDAAGRLEAGGAAASLAVAPQVAPTQGNRAVPMASARSAAQAPQPRPSGAALALLELLVPQPLRAEPRQHDLSLGTAVKICTNTDLPRTQPGDTAARQRERERHAALAQTTRATASSAPEIQK